MKRNKNKARGIASIVVLIIFVSITINIVNAEIQPNYEVFLKLSNHNIRSDEQTYLDVNIAGYGKCDNKSQLTVDSEIPLISNNVEENYIFNSHSLSENELKSTRRDFQSYCVNRNCNFSSSSSAHNMDFELDKSLFSTEETRIKLRLKIEPNDEFQDSGGEYSMRAFLFCKQGNESFIFKDSSQFRVLFEKENKQYTIAFWAIIISLLAVLLTLTKDFLIPVIFKPNLNVEAKNDDECIETDSKNSRYLRIRLVNLSGFFSRKAEQCYVKLLEIKDKNNRRIYPFTPFPLKWSLYDDSKFMLNKIADKSVDSRVHDLAKGEYHLIDLAHEYKGKRYFLIQGPLSHQLLDDAEKKLGPGKYTLKIVIYGGNFDPVFKEIKIELGDDFGNLKFI